jgi:L-rhamnose isomerase/sugar isomerase
MTARALLVDQGALADSERAGDVLGANAVMMDAFYTDVRADLADWRAGRGLPADPVDAYQRSGYHARIVTERVGGTQAGWDA